METYAVKVTFALDLETEFTGHGLRGRKHHIVLIVRRDLRVGYFIAEGFWRNLYQSVHFSFEF